MRAVGFFCEHPLQGVLHSNPTEDRSIRSLHVPLSASEVLEGMDRSSAKSFGGIPGSRSRIRSCLRACSHFPEFDGDCREDWERF